MAARSINFQFLRPHDATLEALAAGAERYVDDDPNTTLIKLRQFGEKLALHVADALEVELEEDDDFHGVLERLWDQGVLPKVVAGHFHALRREGNKAVHEHGGTAGEAATQLENAHRLSVWFQQHVHGDASFEAAPFARPGARTRRVGGKKSALAPAARTSRARGADSAATDKERAAAQRRKQTLDAKKKTASADKKRTATQRSASAKRTRAAAGETAASATSTPRKRGTAGGKKRAITRSSATAGSKASAAKPAAKKTPAKKTPAKKTPAKKATKKDEAKTGIAGWASAIADWFRS